MGLEVEVEELAVADGAMKNAVAVNVKHGVLRPLHRVGDLLGLRDAAAGTRPGTGRGCTRARVVGERG